MFKLDIIQVRQTAAAALAALVLTTVSVGAAVGPARAIETGPSYAAAVQQSGGARV